MLTCHDYSSFFFSDSRSFYFSTLQLSSPYYSEVSARVKLVSIVRCVVVNRKSFSYDIIDRR